MVWFSVEYRLLENPCDYKIEPPGFISPVISYILDMYLERNTAFYMLIYSREYCWRFLRMNEMILWAMSEHGATHWRYVSDCIKPIFTVFSRILNYPRRRILFSFEDFLLTLIGWQETDQSHRILYRTNKGIRELRYKIRF